jgi:hypothetical protein
MESEVVGLGGAPSRVDLECSGRLHGGHQDTGWAPLAFKKFSLRAAGLASIQRRSAAS